MSSLVSCGPDFLASARRPRITSLRAHAVPPDRGKRIPHFVEIGFIAVQEPFKPASLWITMAASGWLISWAIEAVSSPKVVSRAAWAKLGLGVSQRLFGALAFGDVDHDRGEEGRASRNGARKASTSAQTTPPSLRR